MFSAGRVIVGASGSPASLHALRYGEALARAHDAVLIPVAGVAGTRKSPIGGTSSRIRRTYRVERSTSASIADRFIRADRPVPPTMARPGLPGNST